MDLNDDSNNNSPQNYRAYDDYLGDMYDYDGADGMYHGGAGGEDEDDEDDLYDENGNYIGQGSGGATLKDKNIGVNGWLSSEALASMDLVFHPELYASFSNSNFEKDPLSAANAIGDTAWARNRTKFSSMRTSCQPLCWWI